LLASQVLGKFLRAVPDAGERLAFAEQYDVADVVIDCLVAAKDRQRLSAYASRLTPHTNDAYRAQAALNNTVRISLLGEGDSAC
jgi:hypothetical protein